MPTAFEGFKQGGNTIPVKDTVAQNGVIANTKLIKDTVGWSGKNKLDISKHTESNVTVTESGNGLTIVGAAASAYPSTIFSTFPAGSYTVSLDISNISLPSGNKVLVGFRKSNQQFVSPTLQITENGHYEGTITTTEETTFQILPKTDSTTAEGSVTVTNVMIRDADILDQTYEPYHSQSVEDILLEKGVIDGDVPLTSFEQGAINAPISAGTSYANLKTDSTTRIRTQNIVNVPSGKWLISVDFTTYELNAIPFNWEGKSIYPIPFPYNNWSSSTITIDTTGVVKGVALAIRRKDGANITTDELNSINPMLYSPCLKDTAFPRLEQSVLGAKNLIQNIATTKEENGITFTVNSDGSVTITTGSGTASAQTRFDVTSLLKNKWGDVILSGAPKESDADTYFLVYQVVNSSGTYVKGIQAFGDGAIIPNDYFDASTQSYRVCIVVKANVDISTPVTFYPMLRLASDPDDTYVPYAMTNKELTEKKSNKDLTVLSDVDLNNIKENGEYLLNGNITNGIGNYGFLKVFAKTDGTSVKQIYVSGKGTIESNLYFRTYGENAWGSWYKIEGTVVS